MKLSLFTIVTVYSVTYIDKYIYSIVANSLFLPDQVAELLDIVLEKSYLEHILQSSVR